MSRSLSFQRSLQAQSWVTFHISTYRRALNINFVSIYEFVCAQSVNMMALSQYNNKVISECHLQVISGPIHFHDHCSPVWSHITSQFLDGR